MLPKSAYLRNKPYGNNIAASQISSTSIGDETMTKYLVTYHGAQPPSDPAVLEQAKAAFGQWLQAVGSAVLDPGTPTHLVTQVSKDDPAAAVEIGGYSIIQASSLDEVLNVLKSHPFVGRGGTLQVNEMMGV
jgi:hypothetical protein